jgi:hypothetical protein
MTSYLAKLNLRPNELRLVVVVAIVVIGFLYYLFVWPQFQEWGKLTEARRRYEQDLRNYQRVIEKTHTYQQELQSLREKGRAIPTEAQALELKRVIDNQAMVNNVTINGYTPGRGPATSAGNTNSYFEEATGTVNYVAEESALVNFLYGLSSGSSLIRVSSMTLNPDNPARQKLQGTITFVASYPKTAPAKTAIGGAAPTAPPAKATGSSTGPKTTIKAAVSAASTTGGTNPPPSVTWWGKVKRFFGAGDSGSPPVKGAATNAPPKK